MWCVSGVCRVQRGVCVESAAAGLGDSRGQLESRSLVSVSSADPSLSDAALPHRYSAPLKNSLNYEKKSR